MPTQPQPHMYSWLYVELVCAAAWEPGPHGLLWLCGSTFVHVCAGMSACCCQGVPPGPLVAFQSSHSEARLGGVGSSQVCMGLLTAATKGGQHYEGVCGKLHGLLSGWW